MRRQRGKKSSNEPGNASEEEAPDAGEQQPAEPQPDTTNIRDTQQQLQSHINQLQTDVNGMKSDMNGMKSDMATIKSLLQSLTNTQRLPSHRETQPTTTPTRVKSTQPTDIEETKEQPQEPAGSGQEEELDRLMDDKNTVTQQSAEIRRRRSTMIPEAVQQLIDNVQPYVVKTRKLTMVYKELTLAPTQPMRTVDDIVYRVLRGTQNGEDLTPYSHRRIAKPEAKDTNAVFDTTHNEVLNIFKTQINRCWKPGTKQCNFLDRYTMTQCITEALNEHITNPLFMGQVLLEAISTAPETKELWKRTSYNFKRPGSTRFSDGEGKPFHILDLYQLACQQRQGSNTAVQIAAKRFQNYEQRTTDARTYVRNKMDRLRALFALYNATDSLTRENGIITATIETALDNIREKAAEALEVAMTHDLESENPTLNWECLAQHTYGSLKTRLQQLDGTLIVMAENVDRKTEEATSLRKQEERYNSKQSEQQQQIRNRKRNGRSDKKGNEEARNSGSLPDTTKQCTHTRCKRKRLPPHNAGQLDECGFLCGLQLQGIDCPNKGINDYNGRHLYRDTCRQAWKQQRQDSSTGKRHKSPKNGSDNTPASTNMAAIKTPNPSTGRNTTSHGITTGGGAKSQTHESEEVSVTEIEVNFIGNSKQEPAQRAKVPMVLTLDSGSDVCMLKPHAFSIIRHWATDKRSKTLHTGNGPATIDTYKVHYEDLQGKRATLRVYVGEVPTPNNTQGVWPRKLFRRMGFNIVEDKSTITDEHPPQNNAKHHPELRGGHAMLALCAQEDYQKACQEFRTLLQNEQLTIAHVDDCLIATNTVEEHLDVLKTLFQKLVEYGLKINAKSIFVRPMVKFLGMLVHQEGVEPDLLRYNAVLLWPVPRTRVQVRKFVGFIQYFHKYIANCSQLLEPLHAIVNGKGRFQWSEAAQTAFDEVRAKLVNCSYLHHIDYETTKHIRVDAATGHGVGCALYQENEEGELVPLMFASRRFSDAEKNYGAGDAEMCAVYWAVTQAFHDIVQHAPIVIHTDHLNNVQILTSPTANSSKRRQRWAFYLGDYNIVEVRHVPGKDLIDADTLSRIDHIPSGATMETETSIGEMMAALQEIETRNNGNRPTMTKKQIREAQNQDPLCDSIKKAILAGTTTTNKHDHYARRCDIQDGILKIRDILKQREESRWVIVAPEAIRNTIIDAFHNHPLGHRGIAQTALAIRSAWWWPNQIGDVKNRLSDGCDICTIAKNRGNPHKQGTMSSIQPIHPAQLLAIDIYAVADTEGPPSDYPYALTGVYGFSRYPFIVPIKTKNTEEIVQELEWIFASHGVPNILMHDRGKEFEAEVKLLCESLGVTELKTAPKSPHSNGNVERLHRELEAELVRFRAATRTQSPLVWTRYVPAILIKLRSTINKSTKFSPYELMGAKSPILTGTVPELEDTQYDFTMEFGTDQQWENWIKRLQEKRAVALTNDIESRDRRVEEMNSNRPATAFQVGDWVRITMQNRNKTSAQVSEPYQVIEVPEEGQTYRVQNPRNGRTRPVGITEMTKTTAPTTAQVNTTAAGQHQNIPVALAEISNGDTTTYEVIEYSSNAKAAQKFKQYKNTRPHSQASMAKWVKTSVTISNPKVIDEFHLTWNPTSKTYVIPRVVRQRNRSITAIQGRKTPAQNTGGNP